MNNNMGNVRCDGRCNQSCDNGENMRREGMRNQPCDNGENMRREGMRNQPCDNGENMRREGMRNVQRDNMYNRMGNRMGNRMPAKHQGMSMRMPMDKSGGRMLNSNSNIDKRALMKSIYEYGFVLVETMLYLDTHPSDAEALAYFGEMRERYRAVVDKYTQMFGPLQFTDVNSDNYWTWVATPMPWEVEG